MCSVCEKQSVNHLRQNKEPSLQNKINYLLTKTDLKIIKKLNLVLIKTLKSSQH